MLEDKAFESLEHLVQLNCHPVVPKYTLSIHTLEELC